MSCYELSQPRSHDFLFFFCFLGGVVRWRNGYLHRTVCSRLSLFSLSLKGQIRRTDLSLLSPLANVFTAVFSYFHIQEV